MKLETLLETMGEVFFSVDIQTSQLIHISKACESLYGYPVSAFIENSNLWSDVVHEEDKYVFESNNALMLSGKPFTCVYRIHHRDGSSRWLETKVVPILNDEGILTMFDGITSDITKRKKDEDSLQRNEPKFHSLIQNIFDATIVVNANMEIVFVSDSIYRITGFIPEELLGKRDFALAHPDDAHKINTFLVHIMNHPGEINRIEYRTLKKDGNYIWCERIMTNLPNDSGIQGFVSSLLDISEKKECEVVLEASNTELIKTNAELTRFVYSVSHDLRAPLRSILGLIEYSETETLVPTVLEDYRLIKKSVLKLDEFIQDILDYSLNSRLEVKSKKINFKDMLEDVTSNLKFMCQEGNVDIKVNIQPGADFYSDRTRINIILNNLVSNSLRYHNPKTENPFVEITVLPRDTATQIIVKDNGIGIDRDSQEKIFNMFYRVSKKSVGSGLGLYIVKETIEKLNGILHLESEPGIGTTFSITIPNAPGLKE